MFAYTGSDEQNVETVAEARISFPSLISRLCKHDKARHYCVECGGSGYTLDILTQKNMQTQEAKRSMY